MVGTMGVALSVCTLPGQVASDRLGPGKMELGLGIVSYCCLFDFFSPDNATYSLKCILLFFSTVANLLFVHIIYYQIELCKLVD